MRTARTEYFWSRSAKKEKKKIKNVSACIWSGPEDRRYYTLLGFDSEISIPVHARLVEDGIRHA